MPRFKPVVSRKARFSEPGLDAEQMLRIGEKVRGSIYDRIRAALDVNDRPAPPLRQTMRSNFRDVRGQRLFSIGASNRKTYAHYKVTRYGGKPIRDWWRSGRTLRSLKVLRAAKNRVVIGFTDAVSNMRAFFNNRRWKQFGMSPRDKAVAQEAFVAELSGQSQAEKVA